MTVKAYPLTWPEGWPRCPSRQDGVHHFKVRGKDGYMQPITIERAQRKLHAELAAMRTQYVVMSSNMRVRRDGLMESTNSSPADPGVALYFTYKGRQMAMASDRFDTVAANLRSLGLAIEAIRQLERHGGGAMMDRAFAGFTALPPPPKPDRPWRDVLNYPNEWPVEKSAVDVRFRMLAKQFHSDRGGDNEKMKELNRAREEALKECQS
jgi:hypothetical protein